MSVILRRVCLRPLSCTHTHTHTHTHTQRMTMASEAEAKKVLKDDEFRVLNFTKKRENVNKNRGIKLKAPPPRALAMKTDQDWKSVWPGPRTFHPAVVPLPLRQGYIDPAKNYPPPAAKANAELMKIPNFLHLTPPAIRAHCEAIKKFCTPWPEGLETDEKCEEHFPLELILSDYCHSSPRIRHPLSRVATIRIPISKIPLDKHSKDKLFRLVGDKYDEKTKTLIITSDRCPMRKQNMDYVMYLLTAVYHESWTFEDWEKAKIEADMEEYVWELNKARRNLAQWASWTPEKQDEVSEEELADFKAEGVKGGAKYKDAVCRLMNEGENEYTYRTYKEAVLELLGLKTEEIPISSENRDVEE